MTHPKTTPEATRQGAGLSHTCSQASSGVIQIQHQPTNQVPKQQALSDPLLQWGLSLEPEQVRVETTPERWQGSSRNLTRTRAGFE